MTRIVRLAVLLVIAATGPVAARQSLVAADPFSAAIASAREIVLTKVAQQRIPGYVAAVYADGRVAWAEGFGDANVETRTPVWPSTRFRIGSVSKTFTATALGILVEEGRLDLDAPVQLYLPSFPEKRFPITTRQLAGHVAGIRHYRGAEFESNRSYASVRDALRVFEDDSLLFEPATQYSYSTYGWNLISAIIEGASGQNFLDYMQQRVFTPLGMRHTGPDRVDSIIPQRTGYYVLRDSAVVNGAFVDNSVKWAGGGFLSSAEDLLRFGVAHLEPGFLRAETLALLQTSQRIRDGSETNYGLGWRVWRTPQGRHAIGHTGGSMGGTTAFVIFPDERVIVAVIANMSSVRGQAQTAFEIADLFIK
jgi:CubicO group peptidase (beta-lactamase class C family)